ncbi:MAG: inositol monophosphatase family protein [Chloroflexota bacterium]|nr:inositol monophosphatase family protein [Chloroflexota bacterium]MDE2685563.1 inositol monophosphatase family protein [Chloroflexota bacterium]
MSEYLAPVELPRSRSGQTALEVCETAARRAGELVLGRFRTDVEVSLKGRANVVTDADLASERLILDYVTGEYPDFGVLSEESAPVAGAAPYTWVVDPIDGTRNFAEGIPHFCIVVAIADGENVVAGVTYDPVREELFSAQQGAGAHLNGQRMRASDRQNIDDAILGFDLGYDFSQAKHLMEMVAGIWPQTSGYRLMGSSALSIAYTAAGRIDLYAHHSLSSWDIASGILLASEAGARVLDRATLNNATLFSPGLIIARPALMDQFLSMTEGYTWRTM